jgi:hypothetical protein
MLGSRALPYTENIFLFPCVLWGICPRRRTLGPYTKGRSSVFNMFPHSHKKTNLCAWRFLYWPVFVLGNSLEVWEGSCTWEWFILVSSLEVLWRFLYCGVFVLLSSLEVEEGSCTQAWFTLVSSLEVCEGSCMGECSYSWVLLRFGNTLGFIASGGPHSSRKFLSRKKKRRGI